MADANALRTLIGNLVAARGALSVAEFMQLAAQHPDHGYYRAMPAIGAPGDFITAPEISQIFGELLGLCCCQHWYETGGGAPVRLVELGPGRGTLMADMLRAWGQAAGHAVANVHLIESNAVLRSAQADRLAGQPVTWHETLSGWLDAAAAEPMLTYVIANEFFDALPIQQFTATDGVWYERGVTIQGEALVWTQSKVPDVMAARLTARFGSDNLACVEVAPAREQVMADLAARLAADGGAALIIDYGDADPLAFGNSLQALHKQTKSDPLAHPGTSDITSHVDFGALRDRACAAGLRYQGPVTQAAFLDQLGGRQRLQALQANKPPAVAADLGSAFERLVAPGAMGTLFKVLGLTSANLPPLAGFAAPVFEVCDG